MAGSGALLAVSIVSALAFVWDDNAFPIMNIQYWLSTGHLVQAFSIASKGTVLNQY